MLDMERHGLPGAFQWHSQRFLTHTLESWKNLAIPGRLRDSSLAVSLAESGSDAARLKKSGSVFFSEGGRGAGTSKRSSPTHFISPRRINMTQERQPALDPPQKDERGDVTRGRASPGHGRRVPSFPEASVVRSGRSSIGGARGHCRTPPCYSAGTAGTAGTQPGPNALAGPGGGQGGGTLRPVATQLRSTQDIIFTQPHFFRVPLSKPRGRTALSLSAPAAAAAADTKTANSANVANRR